MVRSQSPIATWWALAVALKFNATLKFAAVAALLAGFAVVDLATLPVLRCPFLSLSGFPCPLCGMTRALHAWMHADAVSAMRFHPLSPAVLTALAALALGLRLPDWSWKLLGAALLVFGVFRIAVATL